MPDSGTSMYTEEWKMAGKRVTGRFYVFLMLVAAIVLFLFRDSIFGVSHVAVVINASTSDVRTAQGVIIRDERVLTETQVTRVEYIASEHTLVNKGDPVACVYSLEYSEKLINELDKVRKNIQEYHKIVLGNELDAQLEMFDVSVKQRALELRSLVNRKTSGNLLKLVSLLEEAMDERRQYMSQNMRSDAKLIKYYDEEGQKINTISGWRSVKGAEIPGVVSFYMDGYEAALTPEALDTLTIEDMRTVLAGGSLGETAGRAVTSVFRVVNQNHWYLAVISNDTGWNPVIGLNYSFQMEGFEDLVYTGTVVRVQKTGSSVMAQLEVTDPIGPLIYQRVGGVALGTNLSGLSVPSRAIAEINGQNGVWLYDVPGGTFVPVEVISNDGRNALVTPLADGVLGSGSQILIK